MAQREINYTTVVEAVKKNIHTPKAQALKRYTNLSKKAVKSIMNTVVKTDKSFQVILRSPYNSRRKRPMWIYTP